MTTKTDRIYNQYRAERQALIKRTGEKTDDSVVLHLAKQWKMPCREIKAFSTAQRANRLDSKQTHYGYGLHSGNDIIADGLPVFYTCSTCCEDLSLGTHCNCEGQLEP